MASPTPTSDPVTASPMPLVSDPIAASARPDKPIMLGNIVWTGGNSAPGLVGLDLSTAGENLEALAVDY